MNDFANVNGIPVTGYSSSWRLAVAARTTMRHTGVLAIVLSAAAAARLRAKHHLNPFPRFRPATSARAAISAWFVAVPLEANHQWLGF